jgi:hypothetical protein
MGFAESAGELAGVREGRFVKANYATAGPAFQDFLARVIARKLRQRRFEDAVIDVFR